MSYAPDKKPANTPIPPSTLMSYFDASRTATPNSAGAARRASASAAAGTGVCAHDATVPFPKQEQPKPATQVTRSRSDSIASSYKQYFAQNSQRPLTHSEASISRSASLTSSMRAAPVYQAAPAEPQQQQRAAPYPHEPSKPVRESATARHATPMASMAPAAHAYPTESDDWDHAEEPVMREESPLDTQAAEEPMQAAPPRNAYNPNVARAQPPQQQQQRKPQRSAQPAAGSARSESDSSHRTPYTPRAVGGSAAPASAPRGEASAVRRSAPSAAAAPAVTGVNGVVTPAHSNSYMEPGTPRSDRDTPRRKSDARRLSPHSHSHDPVYAANTPRSDEENTYDSPSRSVPHYPAYKSLGAARGAPAAARPASQYVPQSQQAYPSHYQPRALATATGAPAAPGGGRGGTEDPLQQYPSQYRSLYRPDVRRKRDDAGAINFPFNRSESSVVADSTTTSERGYRPPFDLSPKRPEDYVADDMELDDDDAQCTFQPNIDRRAAKDRAAAEQEGSGAAAPVFSRLYADAQRVNRLREQREKALELQRQMRRGEVPYDSQALRAAGLSVNEINETELAIGASRRATLRLLDGTADDEESDEEHEAGDDEASQQRRRRSSMGRKKVDFHVFERLSKPHVVTPKFQRAQEMKAQEELRREEAKRDALENIGHYDWSLPAKSFTMADLRKQNAVFAK